MRAETRTRFPPVERVRRRLSGTVPPEVLDAVRDRYERLGDVVILPAFAAEPHQARLVGEAFGRELGCRSVLVRRGTIAGKHRVPKVEHVWGDEDTETIVQQHGVKYAFDPRRIMFSAGNLEERRRMGALGCHGETVVDLFAGLGYLSLPIAVHGEPDLVYGCEINPVACSFLEENVELNEVEHRYIPLLGDNETVAPRGVADRVIMGYLHGTHDALGTALATLKPDGGVVHYHFKDGIERWPDGVFAAVEAAAGREGRSVRLAGWRRVKPYAPRVIHGVLDVEVGPA